MNMIVLDPTDQAELKREREESGAGRYDEVWDGVYYMAPAPDDEHQDLVNGLEFALTSTVRQPGLGKVRPGVNVSGRDEDWEHNYREPDVVVFLNDTTAVNHGTHWVGGPDFLVEVVSLNDQSRKKLDFYEAVGSRELLIVDRFPWAIELYRLINGKLMIVGRSTLDDPLILISEVLPLSFQLVTSEDRPMIAVVHKDGVQRWLA